MRLLDLRFDSYGFRIERSIYMFSLILVRLKRHSQNFLCIHNDSLRCIKFWVAQAFSREPTFNFFSSPIVHNFS